MNPQLLTVPRRPHAAETALSLGRDPGSIGKGFRGGAGKVQGFHSTCAGPGAASPLPPAARCPAEQAAGRAAGAHGRRLRRPQPGAAPVKGASEELGSLRWAETTSREALLRPHPSGVSQSPSREGLLAVPCPHGRRPKEPKIFRVCCGPRAPAFPARAIPPDGPGLLPESDYSSHEQKRKESGRQTRYLSGPPAWSYRAHRN